MRPPAQTRLSGRLTVSQMARVGEIECLIIIIYRRLSTNLEKKTTPSEALNICLVCRGTKGCLLLAQIGRRKSCALITSSVSAQHKGIRQRYMDTDGGSSFKLSEEGEGAMSRLGDRGFLGLFIAEL